MDLRTVSGVLTQDETGIWRTPAGAIAALRYPSAGHDEYAAVEDDSFWFTHRNRCIVAALAHHAFEGPLLDVGGGNGAVSRALERAGRPVVLLEPGPTGATNARSRGLDDVVCATLEEAAFADGSFGAAGAFDVVEHVVHEQALLAEVHRVLRPDGIFCVTVPAYTWLWSAEDDHAGHVRRYTLDQLLASFTSAGFTLDYASYFFAPLTVPILLGRTLPYRLGRRSTATVATEHRPPRLARHAVDALLAPEVTRIREGRSLPFGSSILAVARRLQLT